MRVLLDAISRVAELDVLFFSPLELAPNVATTRVETLLRREWNLEASISAYPLFDAGTLPGMLVRARRRARSMWAGALSPIRGPSLATCGPAQVEALENRLEHAPDAVFAHRLGAMAPILLTDRPVPPVLFDMDDVEHISYWRRAPVSAPMRGLQSALLYWAQQRAVSMARRTFVCSEIDRRRLLGRGSDREVVTVPNTVHSIDPAPIPVEPRLLFLGTFAYGPNREGATWLMERVWPHIRTAIPEAQLLLAGPHPERIRGHQSPPLGVELIGFDDDLPALYASIRVACCPVHAGGGTRIKILEAAAHGRPTVSTSVGAEGLDFADGREIVLRDEPEQFAEACVALLRSDELAHSIAEGAHSTVRARYQPEYARALIEAELTAIFSDYSTSTGS